MPKPSQERAERIKTLVEWATKHNILSNTNSTPFGAILQEGQTRYPFTRDVTLRNYAEVALRILKKESK